MRRKRDPRFAEFSKNIFLRDEFCCQFCSFESRNYPEVINLDHNYFNNKSTNLVTACVFCTQCVFLESVGAGGHGGGVLIYLPEITQNHLNALCHVLFMAMNNNTEYKESAQNAYRDLKLRSQIIEDEWGENMHDPALFGQLLIEYGDKDALLSKKIFNSIRLLPSRAGFKIESGDGLNASSLTV